MDTFRKSTYSYSRNNKMNIPSIGKYFFGILIAAALTFQGGGNLFGGTCPTPDSDMPNYTAIPPFITGGDVKPNIMVVLDNSGSMNEFAYKNCSGNCNDSNSPDDSYDPAKSYYGYFDPDTMYLYDTSASGHFREDTSKSPDKTSLWSGNFLNWVTMRRVDVARKVLVGGKAVNRAINQPKYIVGHDSPDRDFWKYYNGQLYRVDDDLFVCNDSTLGSACADSDATAYNVKVYTGDVGAPAPEGIVQQVEDRARFGLMFFNKGNKYSQEQNNESNQQDGAYVAVDVKDNSATNLLTEIENTDPSTWTPMGEALYEAVRVFEGTDSAYTNANYDNDVKDPLSDGISCQKNFVLMITDGESTKDMNIPGTLDSAWTGSGQVSDSNGFDVKDFMDDIGTQEGYSSQWNTFANSSDGTYLIEGVSYYAHTTDLRTSTHGRFDIDGMQNLNIYTVYAFDDSPIGRDILQKTAKYGGFEDSNGNGIPEGTEWDAIDTYGYKIPDGIPDTYYEAQDASNLGPTLMKALFDIFRRAASGSSTSVITTTGEGEGAVYQAFFYPKKTFGNDEIEWVGFLNGMFVDPYGNLREDTNSNHKLDMTSDRIINMRYDPAYGTKADLYEDWGSGTAAQDGDGIPNDCNTDEFCLAQSGLDLEDLKPIWEAGSMLQRKDWQLREIITEDPGNPGSPFSFSVGNASTLQDILRATDVTDAENIIKWVRGYEVPGFRPREVTHNSYTGTWKLGDIINSSPTTIGRPGENYGLIYGDYSYGVFKQDYKKRRIVVYVGGNDGMLHAFNAGFYDTNTKKFYKHYDESSSSYTDSGSHPALGEELWAYIPQSLLPHMKWMTRSDYAHVYYVDMTPKIFDAQIFTPDATHPEGWGTVLIGGLRLGGKKICTAGNTEYYSEYFALDITDPESSPTLLWSFVPDNHGVTFSRPAVARIKTIVSGTPVDKWFMIAGSGPIDYDSFSNIDETTLTSGEVYVVDIKTGSRVRTIPTGAGESFLADPITVDMFLDYIVDVSYMGESISTGGGDYEGRMLRLTTKHDPDPNNWTLSVFHETPEPITAAPTAALGNNITLWLFFGTGKFLGTDDKNTTDTGRFVGIKDKGEPWKAPYTSGGPYTDLLDVTDATINFNGNTVSIGSDSSINNWSDLIGEINNKDGWLINYGSMSATTTDFLGNTMKHAGERVFVKPAVLGGLVVWSSYIPGTALCAYQGESNVYATYYETGTAYFKKYMFSEEYDLEKGSSSPDSEDVSRSMKLGAGMPARVGAMITKSGELKGFSQQSTGAILEIESITPLSVTSGISGWKEDEL